MKCQTNTSMRSCTGLLAEMNGRISPDSVAWPCAWVLGRQLIKSTTSLCVCGIRLQQGSLLGAGQAQISLDKAMSDQLQMAGMHVRLKTEH